MASFIKSKKIALPKEKLKKDALNFICAGVGCNCLVILYETGILKKLLDRGIYEADIKKANNFTLIKSSLITLEKCNVIEKKSNYFNITEFGRVLVEYIGLINIFFDGYSELVAHQVEIARNKVSDKGKLINWPSVSEASIRISENTVDPLIIKEFENLKFSGTICDLGCGQGRMLGKICETTGNPGLGFEKSRKTVLQARKRLARNKNIDIEVGDITLLRGVWEDIVVLIQAFVFHDFTPNKYCCKVLNSYIKNFPNLKYFFYIDIVTPSADKNDIFPGFDYIHGLLDIPTRTYEETLEMFAQSNFRVLKEVILEDLPNTFMWILCPKKELSNDSRTRNP